MKLQERLKQYAYIDDTELGEDKFIGTHDINQTTQAIEKDILELIGEDEEIYPDLHAQIRNRYKSELRLKLKEYIGGK